MLFGMLMRASEQNCQTLLAALHGDDDIAKINDLIEHAGAFVKFYNAVSAATARRSEGSQSQSVQDGSTAAADALEYLRSMRINLEQ